MRSKAKVLGKLALMGMMASVMPGCQSSGDDDKGQSATHKELTEAELLSMLSVPSRELYEAMNEEGKQLALRLASGGCKGQNQCAGLNSCATERNSCAGRGGCQGQSQCKFTDPNLAIKVAAEHMAKERAKNNPPTSNLQRTRSQSSRPRTRTTTTSWNDDWYQEPNKTN